MEQLFGLRKQLREDLSTTAIVKRLLAGDFDLDLYRRYLLNARYYAQYSPVVMSLGGSRLVPTRPALAAYLLHHAQEETGHDAWALMDLAELGVDEGTALAASPVNACRALVGYVHFMAGYGNPLGLFGWMYILEAVGEDLGVVAGQHLAELLGDKRTATRFVAGHGEADSDHAPEIAEQLERHVTAPEDHALVAQAAGVVKDLYLRMFREIGGEREHWDWG